MNIKRLTLLLGLFATQLANAQLNITFLTTPPGGYYAENNYVVVWVESNGTFIKTIRRHGDTFANQCDAWDVASGGRLVDADGWMGATRVDHYYPVTATWDFKNRDGFDMPDGTYTIWFCMEDGTPADPREKTYSFTFEKNRITRSGSDPGTAYFVNIAYDYTPGPEVGPIGQVILDNNDGSNTNNKTWTISNLNNIYTDPTVSGTPATVTGSFSGAGQFAEDDAFSLTVSSKIAWNTSEAQAQIATHTFGNYLANLADGRVEGKVTGELGVDSTSVYPNDGPSTITSGSSEVLVYTLNAAKLTSGQVHLLKISFDYYTSYNYSDFVIYDVSENAIIEQQWYTSYNGPDAVSGDWALEHGDMIIIGSGLANEDDYYRVDKLTLNVEYLNPDSDNDGMPDSWERANGLTVGIDDSALDDDHDGLSNYGEYIAGTHPQSAASVFAQNSPIIASNDVSLFWSSVTGKIYTIQSIDSLMNTNGWITLTNNIMATPPMNTSLLPTSTNAFFYRITVE